MRLIQYLMRKSGLLHKMFKFVIDEDMPRSTAPVLRNLGYEVHDIRDHGLRGSDDDTIYQFAQTHQSILITGDMDFSNIFYFPIGSHHGIIVVHFPNEVSTNEINRQLQSRLEALTPKEVKGNLIILEPGKMRIRKK
jgi:predicted nuclease of predicted toxin-antitoxin system